MDPLSAYRMSMPPGLKPGALPSSPEDTIAKLIPKAELDKLSSSVLQPNAARTPSLGSSGGVAGDSFQSFLGQIVSDVSVKQSQAGAAVKGLYTDGNVPLHQAMIAMEEASVSFQLMVEVRNKLLESYQELMRMQI